MSKKPQPTGVVLLLLIAAMALLNAGERAVAQTSASGGAAQGSANAVLPAGPEIPPYVKLPDVVAKVNGEPITRKEFGEALIEFVGGWACPDIIRCMLAEQELRKRGIEVTDEEVDARRRKEVEFLYQAYLRDYRITPDELRASLADGLGLDDVMAHLRATVSWRAMRLQVMAEKVLKEQIQVEEAELRDLYKQRYGKRIVASQIVVNTRSKAEALLAELRAHPSRFAELARKHSIDKGGADCDGRMNPLPVDSQFGQVLKDAPVDKLILHHSDAGWHVLKKRDEVAASQTSFEDVADSLREEIKYRKFERVIREWLLDLYENAKIVNSLDTSNPTAKDVLPEGVVMMVNEEPVAREQMGDLLIRVFGLKTLDAYIQRRLVEQEARKAGATVSAEELDARCRGAARVMLEAEAKRQGRMLRDVFAEYAVAGVGEDAVIAGVVKERICQGDVRATILAEKIVAKDIKVAEEDVKRQYQHDYGERVYVCVISARTRADAQRLRRVVVEGADFSAVAKAESVDKYAVLGGQLPFAVTPNHRLWQHVETVEKGDLSRVFKTKDGYSLFKVLRREKPDAPPYEDVKDALREAISRDKVQRRVKAWVRYLEANARIERFLRSET